MKISELYGKTITGDNGKRKGFILGVNYLGDEIDGLSCCDENEKTFYVAAGDALSLSGETRFARTGKAQKNTASLRLGKAVYTCEGKFLGYLTDCIVSGTKITSAVVGNKKIPFKNIIFGDVCILKNANAAAELAAKNMFIQAVCDGTQQAAN